MPNFQPVDPSVNRNLYGPPQIERRPPVPANFVSRLMGYLVDSVLVAILVGLTSFVAVLTAALGGALAGWPGALIATGIVIACGVWVYCKVIPFPLADLGATPGMRLVRIELLGQRDGMHIGRGRAFARCTVALFLSLVAGFVTLPAQDRILAWTVDAGLTDAGRIDPVWGIALGASASYVILSYVLSWIGSGLPFLVGLTNRRRQTLHDVICSTIVVRQP